MKPTKADLKIFLHKAIRKCNLPKHETLIVVRKIHEFRKSFEVIVVNTRTGKFSLTLYYKKTEAIKQFQKEIKKLRP